MKYFSKLFFFATLLTTLFTACEKVDDLPVYNNGTAPVLTASATTIAPAPSDSLTTALTLNWSSPKYATDTAKYKYLIEIDQAGKNFATAATRVVSGALSTSFLAKEINEILLAKGFSFNVPYDMEVRLTSSYANNNEQLGSNVIAMKMTPYKIPPKVALPVSGKLFIVGDATEGGWTNPVPTPKQEFARLDETTWAGVFKLVGGKQYLILPENGSWDNKFSVADNTKPGLSDGGDFGFNLSSNFPGPATDGMYKIVLDFQGGKFTVTPYTENNLPENLFMVGSATPGDWSNPVPVPGQQFTRLNSVEWELSIALAGGKEYLLLPVNGSWDHKYSVADNSLPGLSAGGTFGYDKPQNIPGPATSGNYKINVNFATSKFTVTQ